MTVRGRRRTRNGAKEHVKMGRQSKARQARQSNLPKKTKAHVDDCSDDEDNDYRPPSEGEREDTSHHTEFLLFLDEDDLESDLELEDEEENFMIDEIEREAAILRFSEVLAEAQVMAIKAERDLEGKRKRGSYKKNSARTKRYHAQKCRKLAENGHTFINQYFAKKAKETAPPSKRSQASLNMDNDMESSIDEELEENLDDDVAESLERLFPAKVSLIFSLNQKLKVIMFEENKLLSSFKPKPICRFAC